MEALRVVGKDEADPVSAYIGEALRLRLAETAASRLRVQLVISWLKLSPEERRAVEARLHADRPSDRSR